ncbi:MAG: MaoC family dehydratase [Haloglomus sp.]
MAAQYYEDIAVGKERSFGEYEVTEAEIVEFAERYDPQPFHVDPEAAEESLFGGLIASGWHTAAMTMRMLVDNYLDGSGAMGAAGIDGLRWKQPVRPGDTLTVETEVVGTEPWDGMAGVGVMESETTTRKQDGTPVMTMTGLLLFPMRDP